MNMGPEDRQGTAPDRAVLEELERLQRAIAESRQVRVEANQAYDTFMAGLDAAPTPARAPGLPAASARPTEGLSEFAPEPTEAAADRPSTPAVPSALDTPRPTSSSRTPLMVAMVVVAVVVAVVAWAMTRANQPPSPTVISEGVERSATPPAPAAPADGSAAQQPANPSAAAPAAVPAPAAAAELTTTRRVWVRVTVDGRRAIERELDAGARIPLAPQQQVSIRTGDAGAVRMAIRGTDQGPLGRDGEVVTKTFTMPAPPPR